MNPTEDSGRDHPAYDPNVWPKDEKPAPTGQPDYGKALGKYRHAIDILLPWLEKRGKNGQAPSLDALAWADLDLRLTEARLFDAALLQGTTQASPTVVGLLPVHVQTIENLLEKVKYLPNPPPHELDALKQQAESVRSIIDRLKAGTLPLPEAAPPKPAPDVKVTIKSDIEPHVLAVTLPLVLVCWEDSKQPTSAWQFLDAFEKPDIVRIESVGYIIGETADTIALAANVGLAGKEDAQASAVIQIPQRCIVRRVALGIIPKSPTE